MNLRFLKTLPVIAAMIIAASCGSDDNDPVAPKPTPSTNPTEEVTDNGNPRGVTINPDGTITVPFTVKVSTSKSLTKKMEYSEGEDGKINIEFVAGTNDDAKLRVSGKGVSGELGLKGELDDITMSTVYTFSGDLTLSEGVTAADLENGIDLNYEYGTALTEPASSTESLLALVTNCNHLYKGAAKSNEETITLTDQNTYLAISMSPFTDHAIKVNNKDFTVEKANDGRLWIAVPSGAAVTSEGLGEELNQSADKVLPSQYHKVARQYFTVAPGKKVYFSKGNLQYNPAQDKWQFAAQQYDICIKADNDDVSSMYNKDYDGWIDLFGWGTWLNGNDIEEPYETDYATSYKWSGISAIGSEWETLTCGDDDKPGEWNYLLGLNGCTARDNAAKLNHLATVNGVPCLVILPDGYAYESIDWDNYDWADLEKAGAVFLPASGYRNGAGVGNIGNQGYFWSSSFYDVDMAFCMYFVDDGVAWGRCLRHYGQSVRLVRAAL